MLSAHQEAEQEALKALSSLRTEKDTLTQRVRELERNGANEAPSSEEKRLELQITDLKTLLIEKHNLTDELKAQNHTLTKRLQNSLDRIKSLEMSSRGYSEVTTSEDSTKPPRMDGTTIHVVVDEGGDETSSSAATTSNGLQHRGHRNKQPIATDPSMHAQLQHFAPQVVKNPRIANAVMTVDQFSLSAVFNGVASWVGNGRRIR